MLVARCLPDLEQCGPAYCLHAQDLHYDEQNGRISSSRLLIGRYFLTDGHDFPLRLIIDRLCALALVIIERQIHTTRWSANRMARRCA